MVSGFALLALGATVLNLTPIGLRYERNPDLQRMALVARSVVPPGQMVQNLDAPYWQNAGQFLFYSDHALTLPVKDPDLVREALDQGAFALLTEQGYEAVSGGRPAGYPAIAVSGRWILVHAAPAPPAVLDPRDPYR
jgi:hypothetical protein